ncbi:MAG TPA: YtfJ family protein [Spirochaetota bacterium]|nr:YtfJ family protein [Spirochaetota bacterium]
MKKVAVLGLILSLAIFSGQVDAANVGDTVSNVTVRDASNNPAQIPDLGVKVLTIFYSDADAADIADPVSDALKARKFPEVQYRGQGIANLKDSKAPNFIIRRVIKGKEQKYNTKILTDPEHSLKNAWGLASCNDASAVIVIGKDRKIKYINYLRKTNPANEAEVAKIVGLVESLIAGK